jgi:uncharacterized protein YkwD
MFLFKQLLSDKNMKKLFAFAILVIVSYGNIWAQTASQAWQTPENPEEAAYYFQKRPDLSKCGGEGALSEKFKQEAIAYLNYIRGLHGLNPVVWNKEAEGMMQKAAFLLAVNKNLSHTPPKSWKCWSEEASKACGISSIFYGAGFWNAKTAIDMWLIDNGIEILGHRRWLLYPAIKKVALGYVTAYDRPATGATLQDMESTQYTHSLLEETPNLPPFIAYPVNNYPSALVQKDWYLSFSVPVYDAVNFDKSQITVLANGKKLKVTNQTANYEPLAESACLSWKVEGLQDNVKYTVKISGVKVKQESKNYEYSFTLVP